MRISVPTVLVSLCLPVLFGSCANTRDAASGHDPVSYEPKMNPAGCFVQLTDGTIKNYSNLKLVTSIYKAPHLLADGKTKIYAEEIIAYQNNKHYAISASGFSFGGHKSNIASETLPGFAVRIANGRLNVYVKKYKVNDKVVDEYYFQEGEGQILVYTPELLDALIKNEPEALQFFNDHRKHIKVTRELKATARIYNDSYFNKEKNNQSEDKLLLAKGEKRKTKLK